jgi:hypothetical protein
MLILAACTLHNWLRAQSPTYIAPGNVDVEDANTGEIIHGQWRAECSGLPSAWPKTSNNYTEEAKLIRDAYADNFWQDGEMQS